MEDFSLKQGFGDIFSTSKEIPPSHFSLRQKVLVGGSFLVFQVVVIQFGRAKTVWSTWVHFSSNVFQIHVQLNLQNMFYSQANFIRELA
jgi:hypothetical protein